MKRLRFLTAAFAGTLCYVIISVTAGRYGMWALDQLEEQKRILSVHEASVEKIYNELSMEKNALLNDSSVIAAYARRLGYVSDGEILVKIRGLSSYQNKIQDPGYTVEEGEIHYISEKSCKAIGVLIFALLYTVLLLNDFAHGRIYLPSKRQKLTVLNGAAVYDLPQN
ncbi:septum formation initiator family protein [Treponema sp.]|uniref:FtsB family cell division protein n=1 Tax=Treponema sp. TaxID=166 RepID=UPI0025EF07C3|nr:septum formation initiator family protein [Treponema sp.]MCR5218100.1 septum formation initiator family protein [Treponema sp.]